MKYENLPFPIGSTFFDGGTVDSTVSTNLEGRVFEIEDLDYSQSGAKPARSGRFKKVMVVRNKAAAALLPKRVVTFKVTAGNAFLGQVDGYCTTTAKRAPAWSMSSCRRLACRWTICFTSRSKARRS